MIWLRRKALLKYYFAGKMGLIWNDDVIELHAFQRQWRGECSSWQELAEIDHALLNIFDGLGHGFETIQFQLHDCTFVSNDIASLKILHAT